MSNKTVAWLLNEDGTVTPCKAARRSVWPGSAVVTLLDGSIVVTAAANVLAGDDLDRRFF